MLGRCAAESNAATDVDVCQTFEISSDCWTAIDDGTGENIELKNPSRGASLGAEKRGLKTALLPGGNRSFPLISRRPSRPRSAHVPSNEYVQNRYEASFGSYDVDEATRRVTHHVQGSVARELLVGKDLPRVYRFTGDGSWFSGRLGRRNAVSHLAVLLIFGLDLGGVAAQEELLGEGADHASAGEDEGIAEDESGTTVCRGVVEIGECGRTQIAADAGVVELPLSVVTLGTEGAGEGVKDAGTGGSGALIEVAGILVKERGQHGAAKDDVASPTGIAGAEAFEVALGALDVGGGGGGLINAGDEGGGTDTDGVGGGAEGEGVLQLRRHGREAVIVGDVEVGNDTEDALMFLGLDLLDGELAGVDGVDAGVDGGDGELDLGQLQLLAGREHDWGRGPGFEALGVDGDEVGDGRMEALDGEGAVLVGGGSVVLAGRGTIDADGSAGNRGFADIGDDAEEATGLGRGRGDLLRGGKQGREAEENEARELLETHQRFLWRAGEATHTMWLAGLGEGCVAEDTCVNLEQGLAACGRAMQSGFLAAERVWFGASAS